ncbi:MAG: HD-like signal output (HDOD) protein [Gammaproteobacteria bacterium]|jgi:HD-like signal output (HDOD) protein
MDESLKYYSRRDSLIPLEDLNGNDRQLIFDRAEMLKLEPLQILEYDPTQYTYLLEGSVELYSSGFVVEQFDHTDRRALSPLFNPGLDEDSAKLNSHGAILSIERRLFEGLYSQHQASSTRASEISLQEEESRLFDSLFLAYREKRLQLPALPEAAIKIRQVVNTPEIGTNEIIEIVQTDPVLSARLVKVANSPLYGTWREIKSVRDAVKRLELETTQNLSFNLSIKQIFSANTMLVKNQLTRLYEESIAVSSLAFVITDEKFNDLDPEQALLAGLMHNFGLIPILKYVDNHHEMVTTLESLNKSLVNLELPISTLLFQQWNFDEVFIEVVEQVANWNRNTAASVDYVDIVIASKLIYLQQTNCLDEGLDFNNVPIIRKLGLNDLDDNGQYLYERVAQQVDDMQQLLKS